MKPATISRRGFLQGVLGIASTIILPAKPVWPYTRDLRLFGPADRIRGIQQSAVIYDESYEIDPDMVPVIRMQFRPWIRPPLDSTTKTVVVRQAKSLKVSYWPPTLPARQDRYRVKT